MRDIDRIISNYISIGLTNKKILGYLTSHYCFIKSNFLETGPLQMKIQFTGSGFLFTLFGIAYSCRCPNAS